MLNPRNEILENAEDISGLLKSIRAQLMMVVGEIAIHKPNEAVDYQWIKKNLNRTQELVLDAMACLNYMHKVVDKEL
jgi:3-deoxy-D-arabino-heptulosonate 7-phosphate (DAHP) synthase